MPGTGHDSQQADSTATKLTVRTGPSTERVEQSSRLLQKVDDLLKLCTCGVDMTENGQGLSAIREVGPGQHFLGCAHTQANFETAFYRSEIADNNSFEQWQAEGSLDAAARANKLARARLDTYEGPELDPAIDEALQAFMAERKAAFPDQNY